MTGYRDAAVQKMVIIEVIKACDGHTKAVESGASTAIEIYIDDILCTSIICVYVCREVDMKQYGFIDPTYYIASNVF